MASERFSKATLGKYLAARMKGAERMRGRAFDRGNGYAQVRGEGEIAWMAYAEWRLCLDISEHHGIDLTGEASERARRGSK